jgi:hypothetical protein
MAMLSSNHTLTETDYLAPLNREGELKSHLKWQGSHGGSDHCLCGHLFVRMPQPQVKN